MALSSSSKQKVFQESFANPVLKNGSKLKLIGNKMSDDMFYFLAHTPLPLHDMKETGSKIIVCLRGHDFAPLDVKLKKSGLIVDKNPNGVNNVKVVLDKNPESVALVSQKIKKYFDKETLLKDYKSRIFCYIGNRSGITNKLPTCKGKVRPVYLKR